MSLSTDRIDYLETWSFVYISANSKTKASSVFVNNGPDARCLWIADKGDKGAQRGVVDIKEIIGQGLPGKVWGLLAWLIGSWCYHYGL